MSLFKHIELTHDCNRPRIDTISPALFKHVYGFEAPVKKDTVSIQMERYDLRVPQLGFEMQSEPGFVFDCASIPKPAWWIIGTPHGYHAQKSLPHDLGYGHKGDPANCDRRFLRMNKIITRKQLDDLFHAGMHDEMIPDSRVHASHTAVKVGGLFLWRKDFDPRQHIWVDVEKLNEYWNDKRKAA